MQAQHLRALRPQVVTQAVRHGPGGRLAHRVQAQRLPVDPTGNRQHVQQRTTAIGGQHRRECLRHAQRTEQIDVQVALGGFDGVGVQKAAHVCNARVVDDERHVRGVRRGGRYVSRVGYIQLDGLDPRQGDRGRVARGGVDLAGATGQRDARKSQTQTAVGAGNQNDCILEIHDGVLVGK
ncbi:hypothetical protein D3C73_1197280 [compost metagenome]